MSRQRLDLRHILHHVDRHGVVSYCFITPAIPQENIKYFADYSVEYSVGEVCAKKTFKAGNTCLK